MPDPRIALAHLLRRKAAQTAISRPTADEGAVRTALSAAASRKAEGARVQRKLTSRLAKVRGQSEGAVESNAARGSSASRLPGNGR